MPYTKPAVFADGLQDSLFFFRIALRAFTAIGGTFLADVPSKTSNLRKIRKKVRQNLEILSHFSGILPQNNTIAASSLPKISPLSS